MANHKNHTANKANTLSSLDRVTPFLVILWFISKTSIHPIIIVFIIGSLKKNTSIEKNNFYSFIYI